MHRPDVVSINLRRRQVLDTFGDFLPIVGFTDLDGDETEDLDMAEQFVAGPNREGQWYRDAVGNYEGPSFSH